MNRESLRAASRFPHILSNLIDRPLAITESGVENVVRAVGPRLGITGFTRLDGTSMALNSPMAFEFDDVDSLDGAPVGYDVASGIAKIDVEGLLVNKLGTLRPWCGMTGYDGIRANLEMALADKQVEAIVFDVDSCGGEVAGCFDLADRIFEARAKKPIWAILTECAYSAAYALASSTSRVIVPRTGGTGSVGVIALHADCSGAYEKVGVAVNVIKYGAKKDDGAEFKPLSVGARQSIQADVDRMGAMFDALVSRNRGMASAKVKGFEAATFMGEEGVSVGLADAVMPWDKALQALEAAI